MNGDNYTQLIIEGSPCGDLLIPFIKTSSYTTDMYSHAGSQLASVY